MTPNDDRDRSDPIEGRVERLSTGEYVRTIIHVDRPCRPHVAKGGQRPRCREERGGDFYTSCADCLVCDMPHIVAPDLMAYIAHPDGTGHSHCVFTRVPQSPEDVERAIDAMCEAETCGIRYGGVDPEILRRIARRRISVMQNSTDVPPPDK